MVLVSVCVAYIHRNRWSNRRLIALPCLLLDQLQCQCSAVCQRSWSQRATSLPSVCLALFVFVSSCGNIPNCNASSNRICCSSRVALCSAETHKYTHICTHWIDCASSPEKLPIYVDATPAFVCREGPVGGLLHCHRQGTARL